MVQGRAKNALYSLIQLVVKFYLSPLLFLPLETWPKTYRSDAISTYYINFKKSGHDLHLHIFITYIVTLAQSQNTICSIEYFNLTEEHAIASRLTGQSPCVNPKSRDCCCTFIYNYIYFEKCKYVSFFT